MDERALKRRHILAALLAGVPLALAALLTVFTPSYMARMALNNPQTQPLGWILTAAFFLLVGLGYGSMWLSIVQMARAGGRTAWSTALAIVGALLFLMPALAVLMLGPAVLLLMDAGVLGHIP